MKLWAIIRQVIVVAMLALVVTGPVLMASVPAVPVHAQILNTIEKSADDGVALGNIFRSCRVISEDQGYLGSKDTLTLCLKDIISAIFVIAVLWLVISLAVSMLGTVINSGEGDGSNPVKKTRETLEKGLIGLFLIGAPFLLLNLFSTNLSDISQLYPKINDDLIKNCFSLRKQFEAKDADAAIETFYTNKIRTPFLTNKKSSGVEYATNKNYILSDFCVGKIPLDYFKTQISTLAASGYLLEKNRATLASSSRKRANLAAIVMNGGGAGGGSADELRASVQATYQNCLTDPSTAGLHLYCAFVDTAAEVVYEIPKSDVNGDTEARNKYTSYLGNLYNTGYQNQALGDAVSNSLQISIMQGKQDPVAIESSLNTAKSIVQKTEYSATTNTNTLSNHVTRLAGIASKVTDLLADSGVSSGVALNSNKFFASILAVTDSPNDTGRYFIALKALASEAGLTTMIDTNYTTRSIVSTGFSVIGNALRNGGNEPEVVSAMGGVADTFLRKLEEESAKSYKISDSDYLQAALDIGDYAIDSAVTTNQDFDPSGKLTNIVRITSGFGRVIVNSDIACTQELFGINKNISTAKLFDASVNTNATEQASSEYNQAIGNLKSKYITFGSWASSSISNQDLVSFMSDENNIRPYIVSCASVKSSQLVTLSTSIIKAALPSDTPSIVAQAIDFVGKTITEINANPNSAIQQETVALGILDLASSALNYIPTTSDATGSIAVTIANSAIGITKTYLDRSATCKTALATFEISPPSSSSITVDWKSVYERYTKGTSTQNDRAILTAFPQTDACLGLRNTELVSAGLNTLQSVVSLAGIDSRYASLLDVNNKDSVAGFILAQMEDINRGEVYTQKTATDIVNVGLFAIKTLSDNPTFSAIAATVGTGVKTLLAVSLDKQVTCDKQKTSPTDIPDACKGLTEYDYTKVILTSIKSVIQVQTPTDQFFVDTLNFVDGYITTLNTTGSTSPELSIGLLDLANSGVQAILSTVENSTLSSGGSTALQLGQRIAGKSYALARNYLTTRQSCDTAINSLQNGVRNNTISKNDQVTVSVAIGHILGSAELGNSQYRFSVEAQTKIEKTVTSCNNTFPIDAMNDVVDIAVEFVKIPGFPMQEAAELARYVLNFNDKPEYSEYKTGQYAVRLFGSVISQNLCNPKEGDTSFSISNRDACQVVKQGLETVNNVLQLYIDDKATNPNFAREILHLGQNLAMTFGLDPYISSQVVTLTDNIINLWDKSTNGQTNIFTDKAVAAEFLNFAGAMIPYSLKLNVRTTELITTWSQVASDALRAPGAINAGTALRATAAFVSSQLWDCGGKNSVPDCDANVTADVGVFMGVLGSINIAPASEISNLNLCAGSKGENLCPDSSINVCKKNLPAATLVSQPKNTSEAVKNDPLISHFDRTSARSNKFDTSTSYDYSAPSSNPCLNNPVIQLTASISLNVDSLVDTALYGLSNQYGLIGFGESKIVTVLTTVARQININKVVNGDYSDVGPTLVKNIGYVLHGLPIEELTGSAAAAVIRMAGDLPWDKIIYDPLSLGGLECVPPPRQTGQVASLQKQYFASSQVYNDFTPESTNSLRIPAILTAVTGNPDDSGNSTANADQVARGGGTTSACTAAMITGVLARVDFSLLFSTLGGSAQVGQFVSNLVQVLDRMDFTCLGSTVLTNSDGSRACDQSTGTVAKNVIDILGTIDFSLITDQKTGTFIKNFVKEFPSDIFTTGFSFNQIDKFANLTALVAEQFGVDQATIKVYKKAYNDILTVLKRAQDIIKTISEIIDTILKILDGLSAIGSTIFPALATDVLDQIRATVLDIKTLIDQIRQVTDSFDQLKYLKISLFEVPDNSLASSYWVISVHPAAVKQCLI